jgi:hypothetical protein
MPTGQSLVCHVSSECLLHGDIVWETLMRKKKTLMKTKSKERKKQAKN